MPHNRHSIRLKDYDYSQAGTCFITICVQNRECLLGEIVGDEMQLSEFGKTVAECWEWLPQQYSYLELDYWVIMPNHLHGIIVIDEDRRGGSRTAPTMTRKPLGRLIGAFKTVSTKQINEFRHTPGQTFWQRNYYEHIIRNETDLNQTRQYIVNNPLQWALDPENPSH